MQTDSSQTPDYNKFWNLFDGVLVINLKSSVGRWENFQKKIGATIPEGKLHRIDAVNGQMWPGYGEKPWFTDRGVERAPFWGGTAGCALSHRIAIQYAQDKGWDNVLILEDDVRFLLENAAIDCLAESLPPVTEKYFFYLGYNQPEPLGYRIRKGEGAEVWRVAGVLATHAYVVPKSMYETVLNYLPTNDNVWEWISEYKAVDVLYRDFIALLPGVRIYALYPQVARQGDEPSDIALTGVSGAEMSSTLPPRSAWSIRGIVRFCFPCLSRMKNRLNSGRTKRRALRIGLPGFKKDA